MIARRGRSVSRVRRPRVAREVVHRRLDRLAGAQLLHVPHHQVGFERIGMVVVERRALFESQVVPVAVVAVVLEDRDLRVANGSTILRTTVVFPEPEPPATPMTIGLVIADRSLPV